MLTASVALGALVALLRGGSLWRLTTFPIRAWWLILVAFLIKLALVRLSGAIPLMHEYSGAIHLLVYALTALALYLNRRLPWLPLLLGGTLLNLVVVAANGGRMPVFPQAMELVGKHEGLATLIAGLDPVHVVVTRDTVLPWLGDWIPVPFPPTAVASPGDVFVAAGVILFLNAVTCNRPTASYASALGPSGSG